MTERTGVGAMALKVQLRNKTKTLAHRECLLSVYASLLCRFHSDLDIIHTVNKTVLWPMLHFFAGSSHLVAETFIDCLWTIFFRCVYGWHNGSVCSTVASHQDGPWFKSRLCQEAFRCGVCMFSQCWCVRFGFPYNSNTCRIGELETLIMNFVNAYDQIHVTRCDSLQIYFLKMVRIWYVICYILC